MENVKNIIKERVADALKQARIEINTNPTELQIKAGNYKKGHVNFNGFEITIENPKGSYRTGKDSNGKEWKTYMHNDYGYFTKTVGKDGDAIDVFLGPYLDDKIENAKVYPIDQFINGKFDETKVMMGFRNKEEAKKAYLSNYEKDWKGFKYITEVDIETFKEWLYDGYRQRKPFAKYVRLTESFKSPKLSQLARDNGGIDIMRNGGYREGAKAYMYGHAVNPSEITDNMIGGEINANDSEYSNYIEFKNGKRFRLNADYDFLQRSKEHNKGRHLGRNNDSGDHYKGGKFHNGIYDKIPSSVKDSYPFYQDKTMLKQNSMFKKYFTESIKNIVENDIEKKLRNTVRDFVKNGDLPLDYSLEMAEHYTKIIADALGIDKNDVDVCDDDCRYYCSIIDDEFEKRGGEYDTMNVNAHKKSIKKDLEKLHSLNEDKIRKNDKGKVVPLKCKCGGDIELQIHGEPVYVCNECGKYYGTLPCNLNEGKRIYITEKQRKVLMEALNIKPRS